MNEKIVLTMQIEDLLLLKSAFEYLVGFAEGSGKKEMPLNVVKAQDFLDEGLKLVRP